MHLQIEGWLGADTPLSVPKSYRTEAPPKKLRRVPKGPDGLREVRKLQLTWCIILLSSHCAACQACCNEPPQPGPAGLQSIWLRGCQWLQSSEGFRCYGSCRGACQTCHQGRQSQNSCVHATCTGSGRSTTSHEAANMQGTLLFMFVSMTETQQHYVLEAVSL